MATNPSHGTFEQFIADVPGEHHPTCNALRAAITALHPEFVEIVWTNQGIASYGVGPKKMSEHYAYIAPQSKHVNLGFYHGATLDDPAGLLEGTGKRLRHVKLRSVTDAEHAEVRQLLADSIANRKSVCG